MKSILKKPEERKLFALILLFDPEARKVYRTLREMGVTDLRLDHMYIRSYDGKYTVTPDPAAWNGVIEPYGACCAIRREKEWSIHG